MNQVLQRPDFAESKIQIPRFRAGLIERPELERQLGTALMSRRLVLLMAPAGYGKTAALSRQLSLLPDGCAAAWITADGEDDLERFLWCLVQALEPYDLPWRMAPEALAELAQQGSGLRSVVNEFASTLDATSVEHGVIAVDDAHFVADRRVFEFLGALIENLPDHWTVAIATRTVPPLPLSRLRVSREVAEFSEAGLSFSRKEIQELLDLFGADSSEEEAQRLLGRTRGWAAGLCLSLNAAGSTSGPNPGRSGRRHMFDYLATEVFGHMSERLREFLMRCSVLSELTADRCAALSGDPDAAGLLEEIEQRGLFVSVLDAEKLTLRLHDLFRDFLEDQLRRKHANEFAHLLRRAADTEDDPLRKVNFLLRAGAWNEAEEVVVETAPLLFDRRQSTQVLRLIERFPASVQAQSPRLAYVRGLWAWAQMDSRSQEVEMKNAAAGFEHLGERHAARRARAYEALACIVDRQHQRGREILGAMECSPFDLETELVRTWCFYWASVVEGPRAASAQYLARLVELLEGNGSPLLWVQFFPWVENLLGRAGLRAPAERMVRCAAATADNDLREFRVLGLVVEASLLLWQGRVDEASVLMQELQADDQWAGNTRNTRFRLWLLAALHAGMRGDRERIKMLTQDDEWTAWLPNAAVALKGLCAAAISDWRLVRECTGAWKKMDTQGSFWGPFFVLFEARLALSEHRHEEARLMLRTIVAESSNTDRGGLEAMVRICLAIAELRSGEPAQAWQVMAPLVDDIQQTGEVGNILLCGLDALAEVADAQWSSDIAPEGLAALQNWAGLSRRLQMSSNAAGVLPSSSNVPLSSREVEVLGRIAAGRSNKLIARELDLSPHTVKRHVARILDRLDLSSRGQAAAWYERNLRR